MLAKYIPMSSRLTIAQPWPVQRMLWAFVLSLPMKQKRVSEQTMPARSIGLFHRKLTRKHEVNFRAFGKLLCGAGILAGAGLA
jgi:hypothetical protein